MKIRIESTGEIKELSLVHPLTKVDWAHNLIARFNGMDRVDPSGVRVMDQSDFEWWEDLIHRMQEADNYFYDMLARLPKDKKILLTREMNNIRAVIDNYPEAVTEVCDKFKRYTRKKSPLS